MYKWNHFFSIYQKSLLILLVAENCMRMRKTGISRLFPILLMHLWETEAIARTTEYTPTILEDQCKARCYIKVNQEFLFLLKIILMSVIILIPNEVYHNFYYKKHNIISFFTMKNHGIWISWLYHIKTYSIL